MSTAGCGAPSTCWLRSRSEPGPSFLGRPVLWALAAGGDAGEGGAGAVAWLLSGMAADLRHAMTLAGARDVGELTPDLVV